MHAEVFRNEGAVCLPFIWLRQRQTRINVEKKTKKKWAWQNVNNGLVNLGKDDMEAHCTNLATFLWVWIFFSEWKKEKEGTINKQSSHSQATFPFLLLPLVASSLLFLWKQKARTSLSVWGEMEELVCSRWAHSSHTLDSGFVEWLLCVRIPYSFCTHSLWVSLNFAPVSWWSSPLVGASVLTKAGCSIWHSSTHGWSAGSSFVSSDSTELSALLGDCHSWENNKLGHRSFYYHTNVWIELLFHVFTLPKERLAAEFMHVPPVSNTIKVFE